MSSDGASSESSDDKLAEDEHLKKYIKAGQGMSRSAVASRARRQKLFEGIFQVDEHKYRTWQEKVLEDDSGAEFDEEDIRIAIHSACKKRVKMKDPFDIMRWRDHVGRCKVKGRTRTLFNMPGWGRKKNSQDSSSVILDASDPLAKVACPGLTQADNPRIIHYLWRTGALGGGA